MTNISEESFHMMFEDALHGFPYECCGFLFGHEDGNDRIITAIQKVSNISHEDKRRRYSISATDYLNAERHAEENNYSLLGIYHSHPDHPAIPSETDRLSAQPYFSYVIISVMNNQVSHVRSWVLNDAEQFVEEDINQFKLSEKIKS